MPLHKKKPFERKKPPPDLKDNEEVFYCPLTKEIFRDYEEYTERIILCNSLVWSCSFTGRPYLTFEEALKSEENARQNLKDFPMELKIPVLYLASKTQRTGFLDLVEDVYLYVRDRYFVGETVEVSLTEGTWVEGHVIQVIAPSKEQAAAFLSPKNGEVKGRENLLTPPAQLYSYEVEILGRSADSVSEIRELKATQIRRKPRMYSRERNRLFLKQFLETGPDGILRIKEGEMLKYKIPRTKFEQIFAGKPPEFPSSKKAVKKLQQLQLVNNPPVKQKKAKNSPAKTEDGTKKKEKRQETMQKYLTMSKKPANSLVNGDKPKPVNSPQKLAQKVKDKYNLPGKIVKRRRRSKTVGDLISKEALKAKATEERLKLREDQKKERLAIKEQKQELARFIKEWNRQREDLECEDLRLLPVPRPVQTKVPNELFGDMLMVMEFLHHFSEQLKTKNYFPGGLTLDLVERALVEPEVTGPLSDLLQLLLSNLFEMQEDEEDAFEQTNLTEIMTDNAGRNEDVNSDTLKLTTAAAAWCQTYQGVPLSKVTLDSVTLTEVLRLHLLSSGGSPGDVKAEWRYHERGGYRYLDDPAWDFRSNHPDILKKLREISVFELPIGDKLAILSCLVDQIVTYVTFRDIIDERQEKTRQARWELQLAEREQTKMEKNKIKERKEAKQKAAEAMMNALDAVKEGGEAKEVKEVVEVKEDPEALEKEKKKSDAKLLEFQKRRNQLMEGSLTHQCVPIGSDRAYRRFWLFTTVPGLFVEHNEKFAGRCLAKATPHISNLSKTDDTLTYVRKLFEEERNGGGSDKENDVEIEMIVTSPSSPNKKVFPKPSGSPLKTVQPTEETPNKELSHAKLLTCSANPESCPVHGSQAERVTWAFYSKEEELDNLTNALSTRGIRESVLRCALTQSRQRILSSMEQCPVQKLYPSEEEEVPTDVRKPLRSTMYKDTLLGHAPGTPIEEILEMTLRELILDTEEKISAGGLGLLKVTDRLAWRDTLLTRGYNSFCDRLVWPGCKEESTSLNAASAFRKSAGKSSRPGTPDSVASSKDVGFYQRLATDVITNGFVEQPTQNQYIKDLASAILQVYQAIDERYLKKPLGAEKEERKIDEKDGKDAKEGKKGKEGLSVTERWQISLMSSTSFSQLYLHYSTLDSSIEWSKSALNARCTVCRRRGDPENMLLCDNCNKGHHMYCLKPKLTNVPRGDWFCPKCKPKEKKPPQKKRKRFVEEEEEEQEVEGVDVEMKEEVKSEDGDIISQVSCDSCGKEGATITCDKCEMSFHTACTELRTKKPRGKWTCSKCKPKKIKKGIEESGSSSPPMASELALPKSKDKAVQPLPPMPPVLFSRRKCAAKAVANISQFAKQLRGNGSGDEENDEEADEIEEVPTRQSSRSNHGARRRLAAAADEGLTVLVMGSTDESGDELDGGHEPDCRTLFSRRRCAVRAVANISLFAKKLRGSGQSDEASSEDGVNGSTSRRRSRRSDFGSDDLPLDNAALQELLEEILHHPDAWAFTRPVIKSEVPDYHQIIKRPMDFGTIKYKLNMLDYRNTSEVLADSLLVFENCFMYNQVDSEVYAAGSRLQKYFFKCCREKNLKLKEEDVPLSDRAELNQWFALAPHSDSKRKRSCL